MSGQPGKNIIVAYKVESVFGTAVSGGGAEAFRIAPGQGLTLRRAMIEDPEVRKDGQQSMVRLGSKSVDGSYVGPFSVDSFDTFLEALFRAVWSAATAVTSDGGATWTSFTVASATTITRVGTGDFTATFRVGDIIRLTNYSTASDNDVNLRVTAVVAGTLTFIAPSGVTITAGAADAACTITRLRKLQNAATLTRRSYTIEEYFQDLDESERFTGCRCVSLRLTMAPDGTVMAEFGFMGQDMTIVGTASAPNFTSPTEYTTIALVAVDAAIRFNGAEQAVLTSLDLTFDLGAQGQAVIGSLLTPNVYEGAMMVSGQFSAVRTALTASNLATFLAETDNVELHILLEEPDATVPKDTIALFLPRLKLTGTDAPYGNDGALIETVPFVARARVAATGYDAITAAFSTSAA